MPIYPLHVYWAPHLAYQKCLNGGYDNNYLYVSRPYGQIFTLLPINH